MSPRPWEERQKREVSVGVQGERLDLLSLFPVISEGAPNTSRSYFWFWKAEGLPVKHHSSGPVGDYKKKIKVRPHTRDVCGRRASEEGGGRGSSTNTDNLSLFSWNCSKVVNPGQYRPPDTGFESTGVTPVSHRSSPDGRGTIGRQRTRRTNHTCSETIQSPVGRLRPQ